MHVVERRLTDNGPIAGHAERSDRLHYRRRSRELTRDPLSRFLVAEDDDGVFENGETGRYLQAYEMFRLAAIRCLEDVSTGTRFQREVRPYWGGRRRLTARQRVLSRKYFQGRRMFAFNLYTLILHARILLDRTVSLSRRFLKGAALPSFSSFSDHKKFFLKNHSLDGAHPKYAAYMRTKTEWFEVPLKFVRDSFIVHSGPRHFALVVYPSDHDMALLFVRPNAKNSSIGSLNKMGVEVSARQTIDQVVTFVRRFATFLRTKTR